MALHFGIATLMVGSTPIGCLQNVSIDFSYDTAKLYCGSKLYPADVRTHTGSITGSAEFAEINVGTIQALIGGTALGTVITLLDTDFPATFQIVVTVVTDTITFSLTFVQARSTKFSLPFVRDGHVIPSFDFECESNALGQVAIIDAGSVS